MRISRSILEAALLLLAVASSTSAAASTGATAITTVRPQSQLRGSSSSSSTSSGNNKNRALTVAYTPTFNRASTGTSTTATTSRKGGGSKDKGSSGGKNNKGSSSSSSSSSSVSGVAGTSSGFTGPDIGEAGIVTVTTTSSTGQVTSTSSNSGNTGNSNSNTGNSGNNNNSNGNSNAILGAAVVSISGGSTTTATGLPIINPNGIAERHACVLASTIRQAEINSPNTDAECRSPELGYGYQNGCCRYFRWLVWDSSGLGNPGLPCICNSQTRDPATMIVTNKPTMNPTPMPTQLVLTVPPTPMPTPVVTAQAQTVPNGGTNAPKPPTAVDHISQIGKPLPTAPAVSAPDTRAPAPTVPAAAATTMTPITPVTPNPTNAATPNPTPNPTPSPTSLPPTTLRPTPAPVVAVPATNHPTRNSDVCSATDPTANEYWNAELYPSYTAYTKCTDSDVCASTHGSQSCCLADYCFCGNFRPKFLYSECVGLEAQVAVSIIEVEVEELTMPDEEDTEAPVPRTVAPTTVAPLVVAARPAANVCDVAANNVFWDETVYPEYAARAQCTASNQCRHYAGAQGKGCCLADLCLCGAISSPEQELAECIPSSI